MKELPMVCTCRAEGVREVEARRLRIMNRMRLPRMESLTEAIVLSLAFDFGADLDCSADMWCGISLESPLVDGGLYVQCDSLADGAAALWEALADEHPDLVTVHHCGHDRGVDIALKVSERMMRWYTETEAEYRAIVDVPEGQTVQRNADYWAALTLHVAAHHALDKEWGADVLEAATLRAYGV